MTLHSEVNVSDSKSVSESGEQIEMLYIYIYILCHRLLNPLRDGESIYCKVDYRDTLQIESACTCQQVCRAWPREGSWPCRPWRGRTPGSAVGSQARTHYNTTYVHIFIAWHCHLITSVSGSFHLLFLFRFFPVLSHFVPKTHFL